MQCLREMNLWTALLLAAVAVHRGECRYGKRSADTCPNLCSCSVSPLGAEVECSQGSLTHFPEHGFPSNTTWLSIQSANLSSIMARHLSSMPLLTNLQLYHDNLSSLPSDLLRDVPRLHTLDVTGNRLACLPPNIFALVSLRDLVLKNNLIKEADAQWFGNGSRLTRLDLAGNRLTAVPAALLHKLPALEYLDLSDNHLQELQADALKNLQHLETLNLAGNKLKTLPPTIFTRSLKLSQLFLHQNQLQELPGTLLQGLQHLQLVMLNQNQMRHFPTGLLDGRKADFQVTLSENPWVCDERMEYLRKWLTGHSQNVFFLEEVTCAEPQTLKNRQVASLTRGELGLDETDSS